MLYGSTEVARTAGTMPVYKPSATGGGFLSMLKEAVDVINPLQHIPLVGTLYRKLTGDVPSTTAQLTGDTLYGGAVGAVASIADLAYSKITGQHFGDAVLALASAAPHGGETRPTVPTTVAAAQDMEPTTTVLGAYKAAAVSSPMEEPLPRMARVDVLI